MLILSSLSFADSVKEKSSEINSQSVADKANYRVDINTADISTLSLLKGIGKKKAQAIVKYRDINGTFTSVDDLLKVSGIGKQILNMNKKMLSI
ncbi:MAG: helix-hairpin-helix domain-containing protein [Colwellia sp.]|nr:helix-hairpin-helix domain-containing protein [Colwellia sp.]